MDRAWRLLTFGDATFVQRGFRSLEPFVGPVGVDFADGDQRLCPPASDEGLYQRLVHVGAGWTSGCAR
jgi:hypothetical protein